MPPTPVRLPEPADGRDRTTPVPPTTRTTASGPLPGTALVGAPAPGRPCTDPCEDVVAVVAHDLRNPLSTVRIGVAFVLEVLVPDDAAHRELREHLAAVGRAAERMDRLIGDLLDAALLGHGALRFAPAPQTVRALVADALDVLRPLAAAKGVALSDDLPPALPPVLGDRDRLAQALGNLVGNAIKFTPPGGQVVVRAEACAAGVALRVTDTGPGIAPADLPHVFDRFWRGHGAPRSGFGLGLAIVRRVVEAHGGQVAAESTAGHGSTFTLTLPTATDSPAGDGALLVSPAGDGT